MKAGGQYEEKLVLPERIELSTSPLPRECSTTELRQLGTSPLEARYAHERRADQAKTGFC